MEKIELIDDCAKIKNLIMNIVQENPKIKPISDGIINVDKYLSAKYKILWILKESNDLKEDGTAGGWHLNEEMDLSIGWHEKVKRGKTTFQRIIYASFGILNDFKKYSEIPELKLNHNVWETIKSIAYINVKKLPGSSKAYESAIGRAYKNDKEILFKQIEVYNPDIIIFGSTFHHFKWDLKLREENKKHIGSLCYYSENNKLYINAYHPNVRPKTISEKDYCNEIIQASKEWVETNK